MFDYVINEINYHTMKKLKLLVLGLSLASLSLAQTTIFPLITDRPDQTESSITVPYKALQIETGFLNENGGNVKSYAYNTTLLRYGLLENLELRLGLEYLADKNTVTNSTVTGLSPLYAGFKVNVREEDGWKPEVAFLAGLVLPFTAHEAFAPTYTAASARFSLSHTLTDRLSLGYNLGMEWDGYTAIPAYNYSVVLGISLMEKVGMYVESYGAIIENNNSEHLVDGGFTYHILPNFQADISGGIGLNANAIDNFISFGLTYRLN